MSQSASARNESDRLEIYDEPETPAVTGHGAAWRVLVVDDDDDVHLATDFVLKNVLILGRPLETIHARSAAEAHAAVESVPDIAVALVDVVMGTQDEGLQLVRQLREKGYSELRIVLRTGYPGYAPELSVITDYEIDDYRTKDELTRVRLISVLTASIRAFDQIRTISRSREGLQMVIDSSTQLFKRTNMEVFSQGVLAQVGALMGTHASGFVSVEGRAREEPFILSAIGDFGPLIGKGLEGLPPELVELVKTARLQSDPQFRDGYMVLMFTSETGHKLCAVLEVCEGHQAADLDLLRLFCTNISIAFENLALIEELDRLAFTDPIVGVPNANVFEARLVHELSEGKDGKRVAMITLNGFPSTIATYGHEVANRLVRKVRKRLMTIAGDSTVALIGRASFGIIGPDDLVSPELVAKTLAAPCFIDDVEFVPTATVAIVELADLPDEVSDAFRVATTALVHVRQQHAGEVVLYGSEMQRQMERKRSLQVELKRSLDQKTDVEVYLQPIVDLTTGRIVAAEALSRWSCFGAMVPPDEFIPIAESTGLTKALTDCLFEKIAAWTSTDTGCDPIPVAVNLSMADLNRQDFAAWLLPRLEELGLTPERLEFEVTEGVAMLDAARAVEQLGEIQAAGYRIALDDFGTGYSSLKQFNTLPIDTLKIDRSFVSQLDVGTARRSIAAIVITMTNTLNVDCVAEGIETEEQKQALVFLGCRIGQGFLLGRPTPIDAFNKTFGRQLPL